VRVLLLSLALLKGPDFSGIEQFWSIAGRLQQNIEPAAAAWDSLFATPGYAALQQREKRRAALTLGIRAALEPSLADMRDSILATNSWTARVIRHIRTLPERRNTLEQYRSQLSRMKLLVQAAERAQALMPRESRACGQPDVAFVFFLPDGRGYPNMIVADLANIYDTGDAVPFFAHELTHFYYACRARVHPLRPATPGDSAVLTLLTKLFEESVADQHDKASYLANSAAAFAARPMPAEWRDYMTQYRAHFAGAADALRAFDVALGAAAADSDGRVAAVADSLQSKLPLEGRPLGFFITQSIRVSQGERALQACIGDPVAWIEAYQRGAATKLSPATISRIKQIRRS
jgi:hypothetical protein